MTSFRTSSPATRALSAEPGLGFWPRVSISLLASVVAGLPVFLLGAELGFISGGDEGRWQPYTAAAGLLWSTLVFAFVYPAARDRWGRAEGIAAGGLAVIASTIVVFLASIAWLFVILIVSGYEGS
jgi:hypothetical protein